MNITRPTIYITVQENTRRKKNGHFFKRGQENQSDQNTHAKKKEEKNKDKNPLEV